MDEELNLSEWLGRFKLNKKWWLRFYAAQLGVELGSTSIPRLYRIVNLYGAIPVMEAIIDSSRYSLEGDKIDYVTKVASSKWKESLTESNENDEYSKRIEEAKKATILRNAALVKKLKGTRKRK